MFEAEGRVALVTGGGRGIGRAICLALARQGADVAVVDLNGDAAAGTAKELEGLGRRGWAFEADVAEHETARRIVGEVSHQGGRLDILVNNAGIPDPTPFLRLDEAQWDRVLAVDLKGAFNYARAAAPIMVERRWGRIISLSSMIAKTGGGHRAFSRSAYAAAKAGILGLTRGLARDLAPHVTANALCPGPTDTEMLRGLTREEGLEAILQTIPLGRAARPEEIAAAVVFLASEEAGYITGEILDINGGLYID